MRSNLQAQRFSPRHRGHLLPLVVLLLACGCTAKKPLMRKVTPVALVPSRVPLPPSWRVEWYHWESPDQLLLCCEQGRKRKPFMHWNLKTGKLTPLQHPVLNKVNIPEWDFRILLPDGEFFGLAPTLSLGYIPCHVSPDGKWLLTSIANYQQGTAFEVNGTQQVTRTQTLTSYSNGITWFPDSQRWLEWEYQSDQQWWSFQGQARIHSLSDAKERENSRQATFPLPQGRCLGFVAPDQLLFIRRSDDFLPKIQRSIWVSEIVSLDGKLHKQWKWLPPFKHKPLYMALSPDLKRICWLEVTISNFEADANLWVSGIDGTDFRKIAPIMKSQYVYEDVPFAPRDVWNWPQCLEWVPDGSSVSYLWKGRIWTVPVPSTPTTQPMPSPYALP